MGMSRVNHGFVMGLALCAHIPDFFFQKTMMGAPIYHFGHFCSFGILYFLVTGENKLKSV